MELRYYLRLLRRWWWALLLALLIFAVPTYQYTQAQPKVYRAATTIFVNQSAAPGTVTYNDALLNQQLVKTYSRMAEQPVVLDAVRQRLQLTETYTQLAQRVSARSLRDTQLFEIAVTGRDPSEIRDIANMAAQVFIEQQASYTPEIQDSGALRVAQPALLPTSPIGPHPIRNAILAGLLGLLLAGGVIVLLEYLDDTIKTPEDLSAATDLPALGSVTRFRHTEQPGDVHGAGVYAPHPSMEAYRVVRTNLDFASVDHPLRTLLITSASPGEGKSTTAAHLAAVLAQADRRVILVDADLRKPAVHRHFRLSNRTGLSTALLSAETPLDEHLQQSAIPGLRVMSSGPLPPNPAELLVSERLRALLARLTDAADVVLLDSPPALVVSDSIILASRVDATLLVVDSSRTRAETLQRAAEALTRSGTRLIGAVLNKVGRGSEAYDYYDAGYYYADESTYTGEDKPITDVTPPPGALVDPLPSPAETTRSSPRPRAAPTSKPAPRAAPESRPSAPATSGTSRRKRGAEPAPFAETLAKIEPAQPLNLDN